MAGCQRGSPLSDNCLDHQVAYSGLQPLRAGDAHRSTRCGARRRRFSWSRRRCRYATSSGTFDWHPMGVIVHAEPGCQRTRWHHLECCGHRPVRHADDLCARRRGRAGRHQRHAGAVTKEGGRQGSGPPDGGDRQRRRRHLLLPQADALAADEFEQLFGTPHGVDLAELAWAHGIEATGAVRLTARSSMQRCAPGTDMAPHGGGRIPTGSTACCTPRSMAP